MPENSSEVDQKEKHRLGTINRRGVPDGAWAAKYDWTRYRGPAPWPVPSGWVFKDPEGGGWWEYFGEAGVGHPRDDDILEALKTDDAVDDPYEAIEDIRQTHGETAHLEVITANPQAVSPRDYEDEDLEWSFRVDGLEVFRRVDPDRTDVMAAVAEALDAFHAGALADDAADIIPQSGRKPDDILDQEKVEKRREANESLDEFAPDGGEVEEEPELDWTFSRGDLVANEIPEHNQMPGGGIFDIEPAHDFEILRRMVDTDDRKQLYLVEEPNHDRSVYVADLLRVNYEKVGEVDDDE